MTDDQAKRAEERKKRKIKGISALVVSLILFAITAPSMYSYIERGGPVDFGTRPLVVFSITRGDAVTGLYFKWSTKMDKSVRLQYFLTANQNIDRPAPVMVNIYTPSRGTEGITCDAQAPTQSVPFQSLPTGARNAADIDKSSTGVVTTNVFANVDFSRLNVATHTVGLNPRRWTQVGDAKPFDSQRGFCELAPELIWHHAGGDVTALFPEVDLVRTDWTSANEENTRIHGELTIERESNWVVAEAYPSLTFTGERMRVEDIPSYPHDEGVMSYTDQPTFIFSERSAPKSDAIHLAIYGIVFGIIGGLWVFVLDVVIDLYIVEFFVRRGRRKASAK